MYCKHCGSQLGGQDESCRHCGAPLDAMEACGGFWGLLGQAPEAPVVPPVSVCPAQREERQPIPIPAEEPPRPESGGHREKRPVRESFPTLFKVAIGLCILCIAGLLLLFAGFLGRSGDLTELKAELADREKAYSELLGSQEETEAALEEAQSQRDKALQKLDQVEQELALREQELAALQAPAPEEGPTQDQPAVIDLTEPDSQGDLAGEQSPADGTDLPAHTAADEPAAQP